MDNGLECGASLSEKLGFASFPYALRHTWITEGLERGVDPGDTGDFGWPQGHDNDTARLPAFRTKNPDHLQGSFAGRLQVP